MNEHYMILQIKIQTYIKTIKGSTFFRRNRMGFWDRVHHSLPFQLYFWCRIAFFLKISPSFSCNPTKHVLDIMWTFLHFSFLSLPCGSSRFLVDAIVHLQWEKTLVVPYLDDVNAQDLSLVLPVIMTVQLLALCIIWL